MILIKGKKSQISIVEEQSKHLNLEQHCSRIAEFVTWKKHTLRSDTLYVAARDFTTPPFGNKKFLNERKVNPLYGSSTNESGSRL